ncbi:hypothetical protein PVW48_17810 [Dinoroseobacter sp. PD6]|uniref:hypothetical protein n=1 Tax=Dinoroseobacter sp. PD6 TaxID=3028384 RepID=UPI00237B28F8|nr:hypothetical protein [Dinoroseobacter sp. PD6]MDD9718623.1 hypothetical protein [Dinoroseobacter sp. PD6]
MTTTNSLPATGLTLTKHQILQGAVISGVINAVINGAIQYFLLRKSMPMPLTVDSIGTETHTVLGSSVPLAVSLAMILTAVAHFTVKGAKKPFVPTTLWLVIKHGLFAFGAVVALAVVWQRAMGTVEVGLGSAVVLLALVAGLAAAIVNYMTITAVVEEQA